MYASAPETLHAGSRAGCQARSGEVRLGRPPALLVDVRNRIRAERTCSADSYAATAGRLTAEGVPTAHARRSLAASDRARSNQRDGIARATAGKRGSDVPKIGRLSRTTVGAYE